MRAWSVGLRSAVPGPPDVGLRSVVTGRRPPRGRSRSAGLRVEAGRRGFERDPLVPCLRVCRLRPPCVPWAAGPLDHPLPPACVSGHLVRPWAMLAPCQAGRSPSAAPPPDGDGRNIRTGGGGGGRCSPLTWPSTFRKFQTPPPPSGWHLPSSLNSSVSGVLFQRVASEQPVLLDSVFDHGEVVFVEFAADEVAPGIDGHFCGCTASSERIEDRSAFWAAGKDTWFDEVLREDGEVGFLVWFGRDGPDGTAVAAR